MIKTLMVAYLVFSACGSPATPLGGSSIELAEEQPIADVLRVICDSRGTRVETPRVRTFPDGVHARFENPAGAAEYWVRALTSPDDGNHGGTVPKDQESGGWSDPPGEYLIGCYEKGEPLPYYEMDDRYARYEVVDVDRLWIPWAVACEQPDGVDSESIPEATSIRDVESWIRERFGIHGGERVRPGYPNTQWKGNPWIIRRDGRTLVYFHAMEEDNIWVVHRAEGCSNP